MQEVADILMQVLKEKNKNTPTHTHTHKKSRVAVLDIFNKLKPRYKKNQVHFIPPSPPPTSRSLNCDKHCSFPRLRVRAKHRQRIGVRRHSSYQTEAEQLTPKPIHASDLTPQIASLPYLAPTHPLPTKTHTCYMSAGTADKTEGLD